MYIYNYIYLNIHVNIYFFLQSTIGELKLSLRVLFEETLKQKQVLCALENSSSSDDSQGGEWGGNEHSPFIKSIRIPRVQIYFSFFFSVQSIT